MRHPNRTLTRHLAALLACLTITSSVLTACGGTGSTTDTTAADDTAVTAPDTTPEDTTSSAATTPADPVETTPDAGVTTPDSLIGDGSGLHGVYPTFSEPGGLSTDDKKIISITAPDGYTVRYTTDGSVPTKRSTAYEKPIRLAHAVGEGTTVRAACFDQDGKLTGQVITQTYVRVEKTVSGTYTVMLSANEDDLEDMYARYNDKIERAAHAEIIAPDGTRIISQDVGLRLFGGSSRSLAQKSFKIIARKDGYFADVPYTGLGTFTYPFFPERTVLGGKNQGKVLEKFDGLILRNGGNDSLLSTAADPEDVTLLRDGLANRFVAKYAPNVAASLAHFAVVYLNGEYYGLLELRENQNEDYVKRVWGVDDNDVVVIKSELDTSRHCDGSSCGGYGCRFCGVWFFYETDEDAAAQAELKDWIALCKKAAGAVKADEATYRKVYEEIESKIDLRNALEYLAVSCYLCNRDWPYNNVRLWRYTGESMDGISISDGKWRFATRDMDMCFARYSSPDTLPDLDNRAETDMFEWVLVNYVDGYEDVRQSHFPDYADALYLQGLFAFLLRDDTFRADFAAYCRTLASDEAKDYLLALYKDAYNQVDPLMEDHIDRWENHIASGFDTRKWGRSAKRIKQFIENRPAHFLKQLDLLLSMYE